MSFQSICVHEAGHAIVKSLEEQHIGPIESITVIPSAGALGCVSSASRDHGTFTPRMLRAAGRTAIAGVLAERLAGFTTMGIYGPDRRGIELAGLLSGRGAAFVRECRAGAEFQLRVHWGAVSRLADWVRRAGTLQPPYAESLVQLALKSPPRPLLPDTDSLIRLLVGLEDVPEFKEELEAAARALTAA